MLKREELTDRIIAAALQVHKTIGPGYIESIYENALGHELEASGLNFEGQRRVLITYGDRPVGEHRVDRLVERAVLLELKAVAALDPIFSSITRSDLKALGLDTALLLNSASMPLTVKGVGREHFVRHA